MENSKSKALILFTDLPSYSVFEIFIPIRILTGINYFYTSFGRFCIDEHNVADRPVVFIVLRIQRTVLPAV